MWPFFPIILGGISKKHPFIMLMQAAENSFCNYADTVVSLLPDAKEYFVKHGMESNKFFLAANGAVVDVWEQPESLSLELEDIISKLQSEGELS